VTLPERLDLWLNPILVKELRQAVRGRFAVSILVLALLAQVLAVGILLLFENLTGSNASVAGRETFLTLIIIVVTPCIFFIPIYAGFRMASERNDSNVDLLFITTIRARTIVAGKLASTFAVVALIFSSSLPFIAFAYALRGIDLLMIVMVFAAAMLVVLSVAILALFVAALPATKPFKLLIGLGAFVLTLVFYIPSMAFVAQGLSGSARSPFGASTWSVAGTFFGLLVTADIILLVLTTVMITPPAANRALPVRILLSVLWALTFVGALALAHDNQRIGPLVAWAVVQFVLATLVLASAIGEREAWGPRVARTIPVAPFRRALAFLFYSGGAGGTLWASLLFAVTVVAFNVSAALIPAVDGTRVERLTRDLLEAALCMIAYALSGLLIRRRAFRGRIPPRATWAVATALLVVIAVIPPVLFLVRYHETQVFSDYFYLAALGNPAPVPGYARGGPVRLIVLLLWCAAVAAANRDWFAGQLQRFHPPTRKDGSGDADSELPVLQSELTPE
jgi:hypothetical protein